MTRFFNCLIVIYFIFTTSIDVYGQSTHIDFSKIEKLKKHLKLTSNQQAQLKIYNEIAEELISTYSVDSVKKYSHKAIEIALAMGNKLEEAVAYKNIAIVSSLNLDHRGYYDIKSDYYGNLLKAISTFSELNDKKNLAICYKYLYQYYLEYHNHELFQEYNQKALSLFSETKDSLGIASCYIDKARVYSIQRKYEVAEHLFKSAKNIIEKQRDTLSLISFYSNYSEFFKLQNAFQKQLEYLQKASVLAGNIQNKKIIAFTYSGYSMALNKNNQSKEAVQYLKIALKYALLFKADMLLSQIYGNLANSYMQLNNYKAAFAYQDSASIHYRLSSAKANREVSAYEKAERQNEAKIRDEEARTTKIIYFVVVLIILLFFLSIIYFQRMHRNRLLNEKIEIIDKQNFELHSINQNLEEIVKERTKDLYQTNVELETEIVKRKNIEIDLIKAKELAEDGNNLKATLLANLSHEFRTPLNGILGMAEILKEELSGSPLLEFATKIGRAGKRLLNTLNSVLTIMELTSEKYYTESNSIHINTYFLSLIESYSSLASSKAITLNFVKLKEDYTIDIDKNIVTQAFLSLLDNAIKYTKKGSITVKILSSKNGNKHELAICISDTGIGIKDEDKELLFKEFKQLSEGYSREFEGLGLGLAVSAKLVEIIGGRISFESQYGVGSTFTIWIPLTLQGEEKNNIKFSEANKKLLDGKMKILLVEDNDLNAEVISRFVSSLGVTDIAEDALSATKLITFKTYDLILMDINLGAGDNGIKLLQEIYKNEAYKDVPSIAITGYAYTRAKSEMLECGFKGYVAKPVTKEDLLKTINEVLNNH